MTIGERERLLERSGLLVVDKSAGVTSHDVVELVRKKLVAPGAGHLGTLDPSATGLLLVAIGAATRCVPVWQGGEKTYEATLRLGVTTSSQDLDGEVIERREPAAGEAELRAASAALTGDLEQVPPMVSALKVGGRRLHELARRGLSVERAPRKVHVAEWTWLEFALPDARFRVRCSGGTYVRTLAHDLGQRLGCGAALASLRRLRSEPFDLARSVQVAEIRDGDRDDVWERAGIPLAAALAHLAAVTADERDADAIGHGQPLLRAAGAVAADANDETPIVIRDEGGVPLALARRRPDPADPGRERLEPRVVMPWAVRVGRT